MDKKLPTEQGIRTKFIGPALLGVPFAGNSNADGFMKHDFRPVEAPALGR